MSVDELTRRAGVDDTSLVEHDDPIAERLRLVRVVGDEHHGRAGVTQRTDGVPDVATRRGGVEPLRQLVQHDELRPVQEREHEKQALLLAAAQRPEWPAAVRGQAERAPAARRPVAPRGPANNSIASSTRSRSGSPALCSWLPINARTALGARQGIEAEDPDGPAVRPPQALYAFDRRGLSGAVGAEQTDDLSGPDGQVHVVNGELAAIALAQALHVDNYFVAHHVIDGTDWQVEHIGAGARTRHRTRGGARLPADDAVLVREDDRAGAVHACRAWRRCCRCASSPSRR